MKKRIISSIVMLLIIIPIILAGNDVFSIAVGLFAILSVKELLDLTKSHNKVSSAMVLYTMVCVIALIFYEYRGNTLSYGVSHRLLIVILLGYLLPVLFVNKSKYDTKDAFYLFAIAVFMGLTFHSLMIIRTESISLLGYLILVPVITDTFAFLIGSLIGKHSFTSISPNKTIEGFVAGSLCAVVICSLYYYLFVVSKDLVLTIIMTLILSIVGQIGDLIFSKIKRENKIKDFSKLIPGHGGILDRIDSFIFVLLVYFVFMKVL